jgi:hypothetical protein
MKFKYQAESESPNHKYIIFGKFRQSFRDELKPGLAVKCDFADKDIFKEKGFKWDLSPYTQQ